MFKFVLKLKNELNILLMRKTPTFNILKSIKEYFALILITIVLSNYFFTYDTWNNKNVEARPLYHDALIYYTYLPATFIHHDIRLINYNAQITDSAFSKIYFAHKLDNGNKLLKMTMGWAMINLPAFILAHAYANIFNYPCDGFSLPYQFAVSLNLLIFILLAHFVLFKLMRKYFSLLVSSLSLICIALGTNLYNYSAGHLTLSHGYSYFLITLFLYCFIKWKETQSNKTFYLLAFLFGLIYLIRPVNGIIILLVLLWNIHKKSYFRHLGQLILKNYKQIIFSILIIFLVVLPQLCYWKYVTGQWFFDSYIGEHFYWSRPMIYEFLFSYRKGWLLYSPMILIAFLGFFIKKVQLNFILPQILIIIIVAVWINSCWWCWWFGGSFGSRVMVDFYGLIAIPMALLIEYIFEKHFMLKFITILTFSFLIYLNYYQTWLVRIGFLHWDSMSKEVYWELFLKRSLPDNYEQLLDHPDYEAAREGKYVK